MNINPALPASWSMLEGLYRMTGDAENAATSPPRTSHTLKAAAAGGLTATACSPTATSRPAEQIIRAFLLRHGNHVEAMRLLAQIGIARDVFDDAELLLEAVLELAPDYSAARHDYACALLRAAQVRGGARASSSSC